MYQEKHENPKSFKKKIPLPPLKAWGIKKKLQCL